MAPSNDGTDLTLVVGGLKGFATLNEAGDYIKQCLWDEYGPKMLDFYCKADWSGLLFAKFASKQNRDSAVQVLNAMKLVSASDEKRIWIKPDMTLHQRMGAQILYKSKKQFISWGWDNKAVHYDEQDLTLRIGADVVFTLVLTNNVYSLRVDDECWKTGDNDLLNDPDLTSILEAANEKLAKPALGSKGKGKGKTSD